MRSGLVGIVLSHSCARNAHEWGTHACRRSRVPEKQVLRLPLVAQDDRLSGDELGSFLVADGGGGEFFRAVHQEGQRDQDCGHGDHHPDDIDIGQQAAPGSGPCRRSVRRRGAWRRAWRSRAASMRRRGRRASGQTAGCPLRRWAPSMARCFWLRRASSVVTKLMPTLPPRLRMSAVSPLTSLYFSCGMPA